MMLGSAGKPDFFKQHNRPFRQVGSLPISTLGSVALDLYSHMLPGSGGVMYCNQLLSINPAGSST